MWPSSRFPNMNAVPPNRWGARVISPQELTAAVIRFLALRTDITSSRFTVHCSQFTVSVWGWQFAVCGFGVVCFGLYGVVGVVKTSSMGPMGLMGLFGHSYDFLD